VHGCVADLVAVADRDHAEAAVGVVTLEQVLHQGAVAVLEDVQG
jgi:hypothetical protein